MNRRLFFGRFASAAAVAAVAPSVIIDSIKQSDEHVLSNNVTKDRVWDNKPHDNNYSIWKDDMRQLEEDLNAQIDNFLLFGKL